MSADRLVQMANDIGEFFGGEPKRADAVAAIASHLQRFWDPRMRRKILAHLQAGGRRPERPVARSGGKPAEPVD